MGYCPIQFVDRYCQYMLQQTNSSERIMSFYEFCDKCREEMAAEKPAKKEQRKKDTKNG